MSCLLFGDGAEVKTGVCGTEGGDGRDLGKNEGIFWSGDVVLHELFYRSTAKKKKKKRWDVNPDLPTSTQLNFKHLSHFEV